jgi:hypothetical protein
MSICTRSELLLGRFSAHSMTVFLVIKVRSPYTIVGSNVPDVSQHSSGIPCCRVIKLRGTKITCSL